MEYRSATIDDAAAITALWEKVGLGGGAEIDHAEIARRLDNDDGFFVVGEIDKRVAAVAMGCHDDHRGWLKRVAIDPELRGRGHGRRLIEEVEQRFLAAGVSKLRLAVWEDNRDGVAFWERLDYVELEEIRYFTKDLLGNTDNDC